MAAGGDDVSKPGSLYLVDTDWDVDIGWSSWLCFLSMAELPMLTFWSLSLLKMVHLLTVPKDMTFLFLGYLFFSLCHRVRGSISPEKWGLRTL